MKSHQHYAGHMTKMAAMLIYGKNTLKIFFPGTTGLILMKLFMKHQRAFTGPLVLWFSSPEPKAHRWAYSTSMLPRPSVHCPSTISNIFFSETACPIKATFYVEPPWVGGTKVCSRHQGHMTKMAATPINCKNPSKIFSGTGRPISTKLGI